MKFSMKPSQVCLGFLLVVTVACGGGSSSPSTPNDKPSPVTFVAKGGLIVNHTSMKTESAYNSYDVALNVASPSAIMTITNGEWIDPLDTNPVPTPIYNETFTVSGNVTVNGQNTTIDFTDVNIHSKIIPIPTFSSDDVMCLPFYQLGDGVGWYGAWILFKTGTYHGGYAYYSVSATEKRNGMLFVSSGAMYCVVFDSAGQTHLLHGVCTPATEGTTLVLTEDSSAGSGKIDALVQMDTTASSLYLIGNLTGINANTYAIKWYYSLP